MDDRIRPARVGVLLQKMIKAFERERADRLLLLGDLLYHGPRNDLPEGYAPKEVIPLLNGLKPALLCVRGNCDAEVDQMVLDFPILADYAVLPVGRRLVYATHGHVHNLKTCRRWLRGMSCCMATPIFRRGQSSAKAIST